MGILGPSRTPPPPSGGSYDISAVPTKGTAAGPRPDGKSSFNSSPWWIILIILAICVVLALGTTFALKWASNKWYKPPTEV